MIPLRLEVKNFRGIAHAEIDLTNFDLAAVVGENGAGKSTFFSVGPMFTLFGWLPRGLDLDKMVRTGEQEMGTAMNFEHRGEIYRVARTYSRKGRGKSTLELQRQTGDRWEPLSGATIRETEEKIKTLLNLDANTFINSSMILQGGANKFTAALPSERKEVLKKVIGLDIYDQLLEAAKKHAAKVEQEITQSKEKLAVMDEKLKAASNLEQELIDVEADLATVAAEIATKEAELKQAEETVRSLKDMAVKIAELQETANALGGEIENLQGDKQLQETKLARANKMLESEAQINEKAAEYNKVKEQVAILKAKEPQLKKLGEEQNRIEQEISRGDAALRRIEIQVREAENTLANRVELEKAALQYQQAITNLQGMDDLAEKWNGSDLRVRDKKEKYQTTLSTLNIKTEALRNEREILTTKTAMLADSNCVDIERATCVFLADAKEAQEKLKSLTEDEERLKIEAAAVDISYQGLCELEAERDALKYSQAEHKQLKTRVADLRPKAEQAAGLQAKAELLENLKQQQTQKREEVQNLQGQLKLKKDEAFTLSDELRPLPVMEARLPKLELWVKSKEELPAAREIVKTSTEAVTKLSGEIQSKEEQKKSLDLEIFTLNNESAGLGPAKAIANICHGDIKNLQIKQNDLYGKGGGLKIQIESHNKTLTEKNELAAKMEPKAKELVRWQTLMKAFSRNGIPALIIENAVPELESIASEILGQMTNGQQAIRFKTERELKSKDKADTLDIWVDIYDEPEARIYESFSGGEQLRIDFAIRFALAELLARRAGAKIEWLTVDEGLGSQGSKHLPLVLEAIKKVAGRFRKTFVITHIKEAQVFDQIITLEKNEAGSEFKAA